MKLGVLSVRRCERSFVCQRLVCTYDTESAILLTTKEVKAKVIVTLLDLFAPLSLPSANFPLFLAILFSLFQSFWLAVIHGASIITSQEYITIQIHKKITTAHKSHFHNSIRRYRHNNFGVIFCIFRLHSTLSPVISLMHSSQTGLSNCRFFIGR